MKKIPVAGGGLEETCAVTLLAGSSACCGPAPARRPNGAAWAGPLARAHEGRNPLLRQARIDTCFGAADLDVAAVLTDSVAVEVKCDPLAVAINCQPGRVSAVARECLQSLLDGPPSDWMDRPHALLFHQGLCPRLRLGCPGGCPGSCPASGCAAGLDFFSPRAWGITAGMKSG